MSLTIQTLTVGPFGVNCYIAACEATREAVLVDPGDEAERILQVIKAGGFSVGLILITHAHLDHIGAVGAIRRKLDAPVCLHRGDLSLYETLPDQGRMFGLHFSSAPPVERYLEDGEMVHVGENGLSVIHCPGHSPGGVCFHGPGCLLAGDTLFAGSVGRTDLHGGSFPALLRSIRTRLLPLGDDTLVYPGHGPRTTIGEERRSNPFLQPGGDLY